MESSIDLMNDSTTEIIDNTALIGGGIRYFSSRLSTELPERLKQTIHDNNADIYGNNFAMFPKKLLAKESSLSRFLNATSSEQQHKLEVRFKKNTFLSFLFISNTISPNRSSCSTWTRRIVR